MPNSISQKRTVLFELSPPAAFAAYRSSTWEIINCFSPKFLPILEEAPEMLLGNYSQLKVHYRNSEAFYLASKTKSYFGTHFNSKKLPTDALTVLLPLGLRLTYYNLKRGIWPNLLPRQLMFAHLFALDLPKELAFSILYSSESFAPNRSGPTSYETIASITECPSDLTIHEYTSHQALMAGRNR